MSTYISLIRAACLLLGAVTLAPGASASDTELSARERIVGTWSLDSLVVHQGDKQIDVFGPGRRGIQIMAPDGRFAVVTTRAELPRYASGNRMQGTPEEYEAIGKGANAAYGRYEIDEAAQTVTFHVEVSTFPNWEGESHLRAYTLEGNEWRYVNPVPTIGGGNVHVVWKRFD